MRRITLLLPFLLLASACAVDVTGAPCETTDNCPWGEVCGEDLRCREPRDGEEGNCECQPGSSQRCAADGTRVTCVADPVCPFYPARGGDACEAPFTCVMSGKQAACGCAPLGQAEGAGCEAEGATHCAGNTVLQCVQTAGCLQWQRAEDCAEGGLVCDTPSGEPAQCVCPAHSGSILFADAVHGSAATQGVRATGVESPSACRFARIGDALARAPKGGKVLVTGFDRAAWTPGKDFQAGDSVIPSVRNGWLYRANTGGTSGATEPAWPTAPGSKVNDGTIEWENLGPDAVRFEEERFPLVVPESVTLSAMECPAGGGTACDPSRYVIPFGLANGGDVAPTMVSLSAGASISGLVLQHQGGRDAASAVDCTAGDVSVEDLWLNGSQTSVPRMAVGLSVRNACNLTVKRSVIGLFAQAGLLSESTGEVLLEKVEVGVGRDQELPSGVGVRLQSGTLQALDTTIANSTQQGLVIRGNGTEVTLSGSIVRKNGINSANPDASLPGITMIEGTLHLLGTKVDQNGGAGLRIEGGTVTAAPRNEIRPSFNGNGLAAQKSAGTAGLQVMGGSFEGDGFDAGQNQFYGVLLGGGTAMLKDARISGNGQAGIFSEAASTLTVTGGTIEQNATDNVHISRTGRDTDATFTNVAIRGATGGAGLMLHGGKITLVNCQIAGNAGAGIEGNAAGFGPSVTLSGLNRVSGNRGTGVNAMLGIWSLTGAVIESNGTAPNEVGMRVNANATLMTFAGNQLYKNQRAQLLFDGNPSLLGQWTIPAECNDTTANQLYCYPGNAVGLEAAGGARVNAKGLLFKNSPPRSGEDYTGGIGAISNLCQSAPPLDCP